MTPTETLIINNPIDLNSIMLIFGFLCLYVVLFFTISIMLDKKRMKKCKQIKAMIEDGHQKKSFHH